MFSNHPKKFVAQYLMIVMMCISTYQHSGEVYRRHDFVSDENGLVLRIYNRTRNSSRLRVNAISDRGYANLRLTRELSNRTATPKFLKSKDNKPYRWPVKKVAEVNGDIILGGLMMIHEREESQTCGQIMPQGGIQALECMLYTIDRVNQADDFLPGIVLGAYILDDCDKDTYGLEQAVDFIKGKCG